MHSYLFFILISSSLAVQNGVVSARRENSNPTLVWWTPFIGNYSATKDCQDVSCFITENKDATNEREGASTAVLFYGSDFRTENIPANRRGKQIWALLHEESPKNNPILCHQDNLEMFNFSSTFSRHSDEPLTLQYLKSLEEITSLNEFVYTKEKNSEIDQGLAPLLYIQSDCDTPSQRDTFVEELSKYIKVIRDKF